jgi:hypothetical protein
MTKLALVIAAFLLLCGCSLGEPIQLSSCETSDPGPNCPPKETCAGQCVVVPPFGGWSLPVLLWSGPLFDAPECPGDRAGGVQFEGYADPSEPPDCPSCSCEPPTAACELPSVLTVGTQVCGAEDPPPIIQDFSGLDPDPSICNTDNPIPPGMSASWAIGPLTMTENGCKSVTTMPPKSGDSSWKTFARACGFETSPCMDLGALCVSTAPPAPGFSQCLYQQGEHECPSGYPNRRVFYDEISDSRHCSECSCGTPEGGDCTAFVTLYEDAACTVVMVGSLVSSTSHWGCGDIATGATLGGKTATAPVYEPGWCEPSGGEALGAVELIGPSTFCCQ